MKKFKVIWYDLEKSIEDGVIMASDMADATNKAYEKHKGKPPAELLSLQEVE